MERALESSFEYNLEVTGLLSLLTRFPLPHLNAYLLSPQLSPLFRCLQKLSAAVRGRLASIPDHEALLVRTKQALDAGDSTPGEHSVFLEAVVVLSEFCTELAASLYCSE
jgi:hypothetical protein